VKQQEQRGHTPPEEEVELVSPPWVTGVCYTPVEAEPFNLNGIQEGSIADWLLSNKYGVPTDEECYQAAHDDYDE
jgi:hypothetical protein